MTHYTIDQYCEAYGMSKRSFFYRQKRGILPKNHEIKSFSKQVKLIVVDSDVCNDCKTIEKACIAYHRRAGNIKNPEIAAAVSIEYKINTAKLFRMVGL